MPFLKGHKLFGYVDGTLPMPSPMVNGSMNPDYTTWILQDQLIISTINTSLSDSVLPQVLSCTTSHEIWTTLNNLFAAQSSSHILQMKYQLITMKKGSDSITKYFHKATSMAITLGAARQPFSSSEFTIYLLASLGLDYESLVTSLTTRPDPLYTPQIYDYLLNHGSLLSHQRNSLLFGSSLTPHNTTTQASPSLNFYPGSGCSTFPCGRCGRGTHQLGTSMFYNRSSTRLVCQVCQKSGHIALLPSL